MRTSRIAQETSKLSQAISPSKSASRRQTRSFANSLSAFAAAGSPVLGTPSIAHDDDSSSLSSAFSSTDIEDHPHHIPSRKRKRGINTPSTIVSSVSVSTRSSPRKRDVKAEDGNTEEKAKKTGRVKRQPAKEVVNDVGEVEIHPPAHWEEVYEAVKEMRKRVLAPVDTMGCESLADEGLSERDQRFQTLIALMLSSQTKDTTTAATIHNLQTALPSPGLTLANILAVDPATLNTLIYAVGFHNNKTRYIKATAEILHERFGDDIPDTVASLMSLPGVGPKMAYLCMSAAWGRTEGIGVDVHVHRITNLWGWHKTRGPEETRLALQAWLPRERWHEINHLLVGFGQTICAPVGRRCGECVLAERGLCPSAVVERKRGVKRRVKVEVGKEEEGESVKREEGGVVVEEEEVLADGGVVKREEEVVVKVEAELPTGEL
ncbi:DNA N-glycosylase and apurinic/apyrimidinic (AP) lyase [Xylographa soralifera]|nr:DNA N-glycosylase and apurinic/apyrimidinic (AP) lyase [Xylographa soralifera]